MSLWREIAGVDGGGAGSWMPVEAWDGLEWKLLLVLLLLGVGGQGQCPWMSWRRDSLLDTQGS